MKTLNPGEKVTLPDGRTVTFIEVDITAMDDPCEGCCLQDENCTVLDDYTGPCGSGRLDGKFGIFVECKEYRLMYDSLLNGEYTAETTEDYGEEICNLPYPGN